MKDYIRRFVIALLMALCVSLLMIGGGMAQPKEEKKQTPASSRSSGEADTYLHIARR
ncbi:hypothetical protein [Bacillus thermotolerans]|uniref:Uncharacterized protein n=1 Tax=Bacillus thermotolerans TaxID=1221996 RepID=A0A0F5HXF8_BACTR|nr:hypothetical protein [Bacillus thermotolerans]KKB35613.1 hypothetical protein QY96_03621 [Bacillus thermotolerans]KKB37933.1 hypothetical protein QY95_02710 [Bacillus thermotolerans]KKB38417.1 hypothetical protein QY97_02326 [Bacillus thermotolerans]